MKFQVPSSKFPLRTLLSLFCVVLVCSGNSLPIKSEIPFFAPKKASSGGGGVGGFTLLAHTSQFYNGVDNITTNATAIDTTGATTIMVYVAGFQGEIDGYTQSVDDDQHLTWVEKTQYPTSNPGGRNYITCFICTSVTATSATHHFWVSGRLPTIAILAFSGGTHTFDQETGTGYFNAGTVQTGSLTPAAGPALLVAAAVSYTAYSATGIDNGFTTVENKNNNPNGGSSLYVAYLTQSSPAAVNPTITFSPSNGDGGATMDAVK